MVDGNPEQRSKDALPGIQPGRGVAAGGVADSVCRFRGLAERMVEGRNARTGTRILAEAVGGSRRPGAAGGSSSTGGAEPSRSRIPVCDGERADGEAQGAESARGSDSLYGVAGRLRCIDEPVQRAGRCSDWDRYREPESGGDRGDDRILRQSTGHEGRSKTRREL